MASPPNPASRPPSKLTYVRPVRPFHFPESSPEDEHLGPRHWDLCVAVVQALRAVCGEANAVAGDMFVYWMATVNDDRGRRAPDAAVKLGLSQSELVKHGSWKTWEFGVPELVVEVLSPSDAYTRQQWTLTEKREAYETMGVREFVCFEVDAPEGKRVRVWDRVDGDFVERVVEDERTPCVTLSQAFGFLLEWTVAPAGRWPACLRVVRDGALVLLPEEAALAARAMMAEANAREAAAKQGEADAKASEAAAHARLRELEAMLARTSTKAKQT